MIGDIKRLFGADIRECLFDSKYGARENASPSGCELAGNSDGAMVAVATWRPERVDGDCIVNTGAESWHLVVASESDDDP